MSAEETVKIDIRIEISTEGEADTGITVKAWNAMAPDERWEVARSMWDDEASNHDNGGMTVVTDGAEGI